jgi:hypothetical protein
MRTSIGAPPPAGLGCTFVFCCGYPWSMLGPNIMYSGTPLALGDKLRVRRAALQKGLANSPERWVRSLHFAIHGSDLSLPIGLQYCISARKLPHRVPNPPVPADPYKARVAEPESLGGHEPDEHESLGT